MYLTYFSVNRFESISIVVFAPMDWYVHETIYTPRDIVDYSKLARVYFVNVEIIRANSEKYSLLSHQCWAANTLYVRINDTQFKITR